MLSRAADGGPSGHDSFIAAQQTDATGKPSAPPELIPQHELVEWVAARERTRPRWVWTDTGSWYPPLLREGVEIERCLDLRLCHLIIHNALLTSTSEVANQPLPGWVTAEPAELQSTPPATLFDLTTGTLEGAVDALAVFQQQRAAVLACTEPGRIGLLLAAESAGALIAAEMHEEGLPWSATEHDRILQELLGPRPRDGERPALMQALVVRVRTALGDQRLNPDSAAELLRSLGNAGLRVTSTRAWELQEIDHPVIEPLLAYKKLSRLASANGWHWVDTWVSGGRFRPDYVPGGVVTGRWATRGGGALQLPRQIRGACIADPGNVLVVADAAQLEPRILAALAGDLKMAHAGAGTDLYAGIVASGAVETRDEAKVAMLGAMYGSTSGESGRLMPKLARAYPRAIAAVESAARAGERGERVATRLGRGSPWPGERFRDAQRRALDPGASGRDEQHAQTVAREWGRFTRNFIVQGSAAEWALCWMADLRLRLRTLGEVDGVRPQQVFFLHDEIMIHTPLSLSDGVVAAVEASAKAAGKLLFGEFPVEFPLGIAVVNDYGSAK